MSLNASVRSIDLRIAIGDHYDLDYRQRVRESNSNSLAAIHFVKRHLEVIGRDLGVDDVESRRTEELTQAIRRELGLEERGTRNLDWVELKAIIEAADIQIDDDCYYDVQAIRAGDERGDASDDRSNRERGVWADWSGG